MVEGGGGSRPILSVCLGKEVASNLMTRVSWSSSQRGNTVQKKAGPQGRKGDCTWARFEAIRGKIRPRRFSLHEPRGFPIARRARPRYEVHDVARLLWITQE